MDSTQILPVLAAAEQRVLGSLMEKSKTTPDYYPMTLNGLTAACNQKTSRRPIVEYNEETIALALNSLKKKGLISTATGGSSRTVKYKHNFAITFPLVPSELALVCLLLLRGSQTPGELNTNSTRLYEFESIEEVQSLLQKLSDHPMPFVTQLPRRPGQKEVRYMHLLGETPDPGQEYFPETSTGRSIEELEIRVARLELEQAELKEAFDKLMAELS